MNEIVFLIIYFLMITISIIYLRYYNKHDRAGYMKVCCKQLETMLENFDMVEDSYAMAKEIERLYDGYANEIPSVKIVFPNVIVWIDAAIFRIDSKYGYAKELRKYSKEIKNARDVLVYKYPYCKCNPVQQDILKDINKIKDKSNEVVVDNIIARTEKEFLRTLEDIKKNERKDNISVMIGIIGIVVSILMAFVKM